MLDLPWYVRSGFAAAMVILLAGALALAYIHNDDATRQLIVGAIIGNFSAIISYYFGSSEGSRKKDETLANATAALATSAPVATTAEPAKTP